MSNLQIRRGAAAAVDAVVLEQGEPILDLTNELMHIGTGGTLTTDRFTIGGGNVAEWGAIVSRATGNTGEIISLDANEHDYSTGGVDAIHIDPKRATNILISPTDLVSFGNGTDQIWRYMGPKTVSIGPDATAPVDSVPHYVTTEGDFQLTGVLQFDNVWYASTMKDDPIVGNNLIDRPAKQGDVGITQDDNVVYKLSSQDPTVVADWEVIGSQDPVGAGTSDDVFEGVADETAMLALAAAVGDVVSRRLDNHKTYKLSGLPATSTANWVMIGGLSETFYAKYMDTGSTGENLTERPAVIGDIGITTDDGITYVLSKKDPTVIANWEIIGQNTHDYGVVL